MNWFQGDGVSLQMAPRNWLVDDGDRFKRHRHHLIYAIDAKTSIDEKFINCHFCGQLYSTNVQTVPQVDKFQLKCTNWRLMRHSGPTQSSKTYKYKYKFFVEVFPIWWRRKTSHLLARRRRNYIRNDWILLSLDDFGHATGGRKSTHSIIFMSLFWHVVAVRVSP